MPDICFDFYWFLQFNDADEYETLYQIDQCFQQENSEPCRNGRNPCRTLQFRKNSQDAEDHSGDGRWPERSRLES